MLNIHGDVKGRCFATTSNSIKRCTRTISIKKEMFCKTHQNIVNKKKTIQLFTGRSLEYGDNNSIIKYSNEIYLWTILNNMLLKEKNIAKYDEIVKLMLLIKNGKKDIVMKELVSRNITKGILSKKLLFIKDIKHFIGVCLYFEKNIDILKKIQFNIRIKIKYKKEISNIIKIQKWFRYSKWYKNLPIKPIEMVKYYIPRLNSIIKIQQYVKKILYIRSQHSYDCPYTLESYKEIPKIVSCQYKTVHNKINHYHYYNIIWLHYDWITQTQQKRFVIDPSTRSEFSEEFIEKVARKVWTLTRIKKIYSLETHEPQTEKYNIENDWSNIFARRSAYRFILMFLDLCDMLKIKVNNILEWRTSEYKMKYFRFYIDVCKLVCDINRENNGPPILYGEIYHYTHSILRTKVLMENNNCDIVAGNAIYGIIKIIQCLRFCPDTLQSFLFDIIKNNFISMI